MPLHHYQTRTGSVKKAGYLSAWHGMEIMVLLVWISACGSGGHAFPRLYKLPFIHCLLPHRPTLYYYTYTGALTWTTPLPLWVTFAPYWIITDTLRVCTRFHAPCPACHPPMGLPHMLPSQLIELTPHPHTCTPTICRPFLPPTFMVPGAG